MNFYSAQLLCMLYDMNSENKASVFYLFMNMLSIALSISLFELLKDQTGLKVYIINWLMTPQRAYIKRIMPFYAFGT